LEKHSDNKKRTFISNMRYDQTYCYKYTTDSTLEPVHELQGVPIENFVALTYGERSSNFWGVTFGNEVIDLTTNERDTLPAEDPVIDIFCRANTYMVLTKSGRVYAGGDNAWSQTGHGSSSFAEITYFSENNIRIKYVRPGYGHAIFLADDGALYATGSNDFGQLAQGSSELTKSATPIKAKLPPIRHFATGYAQVITITQSDDILVFGSNSYGQIGSTTTKVFAIEQRYLPPDVGTIMKIDCGQFHTVILTTERKLFTMGRNYFMLKDNVVEAPTNSQLTAVELPLELQDSLIDVFCIQSNTVVVTDTGGLYLGTNNNGKSFVRIGDIPVLSHHDLRIQGDRDQLIIFSRPKFDKLIYRQFPRLANLINTVGGLSDTEVFCQ
jgi:hypothetical protein